MTTAIAYWPFENNLTDVVGGNILTPDKTPVYDTGVVGSCLKLNGDNENGGLRCTSIAGLDYTQPISIEMYVKLGYAIDGEQYFEVSDGVLNTIFAYAHYDYLDFVDGAFYIQGGSFFAQVYYDLNFDTFQKVKVTYDGVSRWELYVNDILQIPTSYRNMTYTPEDGLWLRADNAWIHDVWFDEIKINGDVSIEDPVVESSSISTSKKYIPVINNQRITPYVGNSNDIISVKYQLLSDNKNRLSYLKDKPVVLNLNYSGWIPIASGITNKFGAYTFHVSCSGLNISNCLGYVSTDINDSIYNSNIIRINFTPVNE